MSHFCSFLTCVIIEHALSSLRYFLNSYYIHSFSPFFSSFVRWFFFVMLLFFQFYIYYYNFRFKTIMYERRHLHIYIHVRYVKSILTGSDSHVCALILVIFNICVYVLLLLLPACLLAKQKFNYAFCVCEHIMRVVLNIKNISYSVAHSFTKQF